MLATSPQLQQFEVLSPLANTRLAVEHGPTAEPDRNRRNRQRRARQHEPDRRADEVEAAVQRSRRDRT